jgi:hypothetical protein
VVYQDTMVHARRWAVAWRGPVSVSPLQSWPTLGVCFGICKGLAGAERASAPSRWVTRVLVTMIICNEKHSKRVLYGASPFTGAHGLLVLNFF